MHIQANLPRDDTAHIEQVFNKLGLNTGITFDGIEPLLEFLALKVSLAENVCPTQNSIQRRAKFMAECRQKIVFDATGALGLRTRLSLALEEAQPLQVGFLAFLPLLSFDR